MLWAASLFLPAVGLGKVADDPGWHILWIGWLGLFDGILSWLANLVLLPSMLISNSIEAARCKIITLFSILVLSVSALQTLWLSDIHTDQGIFPVLYGSGYYLWLSAVLLQATLLSSRLVRGLLASPTGT
jgi:hypothetical protein